MYSFLVDDNSKHKKGKDVNKNVISAISHSEYKDDSLNQKYLRYSTDRIKSKNHRLGTYEINKTSLSYFDDKIYTRQ